MKPERLAWDSDFFQCRVGRLAVGPDQEISTIEFDDFDFVYLIVEKELSPIKKRYFENIAFLADEKLTYEKETINPDSPDANILSWPPQRELVGDLLDVAVQSGEYSRFKVDPHIPNEKFIELYEVWITNSVKRIIAEEVYYFSINDHIGGVITLSIKNNKADIGILSVNRTFRGQGIATKLVIAAEYWAEKVKGKKSIQVVTQAANDIACRFYETCGFRVHKREYVFHWWRKDR